MAAAVHDRQHHPPDDGEGARFDARRRRHRQDGTALTLPLLPLLRWETAQALRSSAGAGAGCSGREFLGLRWVAMGLGWRGEGVMQWHSICMNMSSHTLRALTQRQTKRMVSEAPQEIMTAVVGAAASNTRDPMLLLSINTSDTANTRRQRARGCTYMHVKVSATILNMMTCSMSGRAHPTPRPFLNRQHGCMCRLLMMNSRAAASSLQTNILLATASRGCYSSAV